MGFRRPELLKGMEVEGRADLTGGTHAPLLTVAILFRSKTEFKMLSTLAGEGVCDISKVFFRECWSLYFNYLLYFSTTLPHTKRGLISVTVNYV